MYVLSKIWTYSVKPLQNYHNISIFKMMGAMVVLKY